MKYSSAEFLKVATTTAEHFGFRTADLIKKDPLCKNCAAPLPYTASPEDATIDAHGGLLAQNVMVYCQEKLHALGAPVLLYSLEQIPQTDTTALAFSIFNVPKSIAEAILIQASRSLLEELGETDHVVRINSLGDTESSTRYTRELTTFLRKRLESMPADARELMKQHPFLALRALVEQDHELATHSPNPLEFLSDPSRKHFREIVEYLDMTETPYEIDPKMIGHHEYYSDALFAIENSEPTNGPRVTIRGGRHDEFLYRKTKSRISAVGAVITFHNSKPTTRMPKAKSPEPSVFVIQLGFGPKIRSLLVIDQLKRAGIPVRHDLASDSLSAQLRLAETQGIPYTVIIGQKEFVDNTVIFRDMKERNQEQTSIESVIKKLKKQMQVL